MGEARGRVRMKEQYCPGGSISTSIHGDAHGQRYSVALVSKSLIRSFARATFSQSFRVREWFNTFVRAYVFVLSAYMCAACCTFVNPCVRVTIRSIVRFQCMGTTVCLHARPLSQRCNKTEHTCIHNWTPGK